MTDSSNVCCLRLGLLNIEHLTFCHCVLAPMSRDRDPYGPPSRRDSMMSRRDDYPSPRDDHYNSKDRWEFLYSVIHVLTFSLLPSCNIYTLDLVSCTMFCSYSSRDYNSRDSRDYGPPPRDYSYREYSNSNSRDDYSSMSRGYRYNLTFLWK